ncbi:MAG: hypothetical protein JXR48_10660 [Candidatus Delongbacteria bacterium]|nr:hypothetical protein [Candidatus Delongbacteria bacterium]
MRIKHHIGGNEKTDKIKKQFDKLNIKYKETMNIITADIYEDDKNWSEIQQLIIQKKLTDMIEKVFSKKELKESKWLKLRSGWYWDYPKPDYDMEYRKITYKDSNYCIECGSGLIQTAPFRLKSEPKWGNKAILQLNWVYDELFIKSELYNQLIALGFSGISSQKVINNQNDDVLKSVFQLNIEKKLLPGLIKDKNNIEPYICNSCGITKYQYNPKQIISYKSEAFSDASDFNKTSELFGAKDNKISIPFIIVSNKVYNFFEENKWKQPIFEPLSLVE